MLQKKYKINKLISFITSLTVATAGIDTTHNGEAHKHTPFPFETHKECIDRVQYLLNEHNIKIDNKELDYMQIIGSGQVVVENVGSYIAIMAIRPENVIKDFHIKRLFLLALNGEPYNLSRYELKQMIYNQEFRFVMQDMKKNKLDPNKVIFTLHCDTDNLLHFSYKDADTLNDDSICFNVTKQNESLTLIEFIKQFNIASSSYKQTSFCIKISGPYFNKYFIARNAGGEWFLSSNQEGYAYNIFEPELSEGVKTYLSSLHCIHYIRPRLKKHKVRIEPKTGFIKFYEICEDGHTSLLTIPPYLFLENILSK